MRTSSALGLAAASYAVTVTSILVSCRLWLDLVGVPRGTSIRPMGLTLYADLAALAGTLVAGSLAVTIIVKGRGRAVPMFAGLVSLFLALLPLPITLTFMDWLVDRLGLVLAS